MLSRKLEISLLCGLSVLFISVLYYIASLSPGLEGGMDSYNHYLIAKFSWQHPGELLLDQWGKPLYNILASPFAQLGLMGVVTFNVLLLVGTGWIVWATAKTLGFNFAWLGFIATITSPIWLDNTISGLTEPLNAFLLALMVYWFARRKLLHGAILAGFLPFARSEGYVIMAVVGFYLFFVLKHYKAFGFLLVGSVVMNLVGWMVEGDWLWIYNTNPYIKYQLESAAKKENICGHGTWDHYLDSLPWVMGNLRLLFFALGTGLLTLAFLRDRKNTNLALLFWLVLGSYALYFFVHSAIWYKGVMGSCGYQRVLVVISPLATLVILYALDFGLGWLRNILPRRMHHFIVVLGLLISGWMIYEPYDTYKGKYPIDISDEQKLFVEAAEWYNQQDYDDRMKYFLYPYFNILTDIDPKDTDHFIELWSFDARYAPVGSIVIWDGHFGPNEGNVPLELLDKHQDFTRLKSFIPAKPFKTLNDYNFEIHVFERTGDAELHR